MAKGKAVAVADEEVKAVAVATSYADDAGAGFEDVSAEDLIIPRISILQKMSPQVDSDNQAYVEGAKAGKLINSVSGQLYEKEGFEFIPVHRTHEFLEFVLREEGGGFKGAHAPDSGKVAEARARAGGNWSKLTSRSDDGKNTQLIETFSVYGILIEEDGNFGPAVLSFSSSNIGTYKRWMTMARSVQLRTEDGRRITPPLFAHRFRVATQYQENAKGSWYSYAVRWAEGNAENSRLSEEHELYLAAKEIRDMVVNQGARAGYDEGGSEGSSTPAKGGAAKEVDDVF